MEICYTYFLSPFGWCGIVKGQAGLLRIFLPENNRDMLEERIRASFSLFSEYSPDELHRETSALQTYFSGGCPDFPFVLDLSGATVFQKAVWKAVQGIPYGQMKTYQWVAKRIKKPDAMRAVGNALGRNPLPIIIPCHRVIRMDGDLGGFSAPSGIRLKKALLALEGITLPEHVS
jgi:O-6-methylguanine DNA methyltransferase